MLVQYRHHPARGTGERRAAAQPKTTVFQRLGNTGLRSHRGKEWKADDLGHVGGSQPARCGPPHDQASVGVHRGNPACDAFGCGAGPHISRGEDDDEIRGFECGLGRRGRSPRHVADHRRAAPAARIDDGTEGRGVDVAASATAREHTNAALPWQRIA